MDEDYLDKLAKRQMQKIKLLVSRPEFQKDILVLREKWDIHKKGFKNEKENQKWNRELWDKEQKYFATEWPKYRDELLILRNNPKTYMEHKRRQQEINNAAPINAFQIDIRVIMKKYQLSHLWDTAIKRYLLFNDLEKMGMFLGPVIVTEEDRYGFRKVLLDISDGITFDELKEFYSEIKNFQAGFGNNKQKKFQPLKRFDRNKDAYELRQKGKSLKDIAEFLREKYKEPDITYADISDFIRRHKQRLGIN